MSRRCPTFFADRAGVYRTCTAFALVALLWASTALAAPTAEQRAQIRDATKFIGAAGKSFVDGRFEKAGEWISKAEALLVALEAAENKDELLPQIRPLSVRVARARELLKAKGVEIPEPTAPTAPGAGGVSFTKQIVPIITSRCGGCHVRQARGEFSMASYEAFMKGVPTGAVLSPGAGKGSIIIDLIESGDMPRGGGRVPAGELALLIKWIDEGAKFDGTDPKASITGQPAPQPTPQPAPAPEPGAGGVSFAAQIAPVLSTQCADCHGGNQPRGGLSLQNFAGIQAGNIVMPGNAAGSLLIRKLKGMAGQRMPLNRPALSPTVIATFEKWITEGAKYDGPNPTTTVADLARLYATKGMSADQLSAQRLETAMRNWKLAIPDFDPAQAQTKNFLLLGTTNRPRLEEIGKHAEEMHEFVARQFKLPTDQPLFKGRLTVFVFQQRFDYSEFGTMVERRDIPKHWRAHWMTLGADAYVSLVPPRTDEYSLDAQLAEQIAGAYLAGLGQLPSWFTVGTAKNIATRVDPKSGLGKQWDSMVGTVLRRTTAPTRFLEGDAASEDDQLLAYSFADYLMGNRKFFGLLSKVQNKAKFTAAFEESFNSTIDQMAYRWAQSAARKR